MIKQIKKSFRKNLILAFIFVAVIPLLISCLFLIQLFCVKLEADNKKQDEEAISSISSILNQQFYEYEVVIDNVCKDEKAIATLQTDSAIEHIKLYNILYQNTRAYRDYAFFNLYDENGKCKLTTAAINTKEDLPTYWGILRFARTYPEELIITGAKDYINESSLILRACKVIKNENDDIVGYFVIDMDKSHMEKLLSEYAVTQTGIAIVDNMWECIYDSGAAADWGIAGIMRNHLLENQEIFEEYNEYDIYSQDILNGKCKLIYMRKKPFSGEMLKSMYIIMISMTIVSIVLCIFVSILMSKKLTKPLSELTNAMQEVEAGNLDIKLEENRKDEFGFVAKRFNQMISQIKEYMNQKVLHQKELNDVNIAMLHAQLNPHFLYNTLDTMKWLAKANGVPQVALIATKLAKILRMSISKEEVVTLNQELSFVSDYIEIQKIRYDESFEYECEVEDFLLDCFIPKQIIQPIVENALIHGVGELQNRKGLISVSAKENNHNLEVKIIDNGDGIPQEILDKLNKKDRKELSGHIGFYNVDTIIQLNYGKQYGLQASNIETGGTCITMTLPLRWES